MTNKWVLDCSAMASVMLMETDGRETDDLLEQALAERIHISVPSLFWYEISNVLTTAVRKKRLEINQARGALARLCELPIGTDTTDGVVVYRRIFDLALMHDLSFYDAAYLELADRIGASLKTFDKAILRLGRHYPWIH